MEMATWDMEVRDGISEESRSQAEVSWKASSQGSRGSALPRFQSQSTLDRLKKKKDWKKRRASYDKGSQEKLFSVIIMRLEVF